VNTEQENRLREDLRRAVDGETFRTDPDVVLGRARRARRRTLVTRGAVGTGVLAVVVAATLASVPTGVPEVRNAAYVVERVSAALDGGPGYVYRSVDHDEGTVWYQDQVTMSQYWVYGTGATRIEAWDSSPVIDHAAHLRDTTVNHKDRTFSTEDTKLPGYVAGELPPKTSFADRIKKSITGGQEIVGSGEYRGHQVIKLGHPAGELWVDATTYLPVYRVTTDADGRKTASDLAFLPRTPDLVKTVNTPQIPAGFTEVAEANTGPGHGG
jgi:hypothetical protein